MPSATSPDLVQGLMQIGERTAITARKDADGKFTIVSGVMRARMMMMSRDLEGWEPVHIDGDLYRMIPRLRTA